MVEFYLDQNFDAKFLRNRLERIPIVIADTAAATAANYGVFWIAPAKCVLVEAWETHKVAGSDGGAVTLDIEKLTSGTAADSGTAMLSTTFNLKSTANTPVRVTASLTPSVVQIARGDRLCLKDAGTLAAVSGVCVVATVRYSN